MVERTGRRGLLGRITVWLTGWARRLYRALRTRRGQRRAFQLVAALAVLAMLAPAWLYLSTDGRLRTVADAPSEPVAVVFGAGLQPDGTPSAYLADRLNTALELYHLGKVKAFLVTGDNDRLSYDEPDAMRTYLLEHGVPADRVVRDYAGFHTWDSCSRARRIFGVRSALLVSQGFHIRRAVALCRSVGIDAYGVATTQPRDRTWYYGAVRELPAASEALLDVVFQPAPTFLGPRVTSLARWR
jgi:vancomycin permeability regulator SanA